MICGSCPLYNQTEVPSEGGCAVYDSLKLVKKKSGMVVLPGAPCLYDLESAADLPITRIGLVNLLDTKPEFLNGEIDLNDVFWDTYYQRVNSIVN